MSDAEVEALYDATKKFYQVCEAGYYCEYGISYACDAGYYCPGDWMKHECGGAHVYCPGGATQVSETVLFSCAESSELQKICGLAPPLARSFRPQTSAKDITQSTAERTLASRRSNVKLATIARREFGFRAAAPLTDLCRSRARTRIIARRARIGRAHV